MPRRKWHPFLRAGRLLFILVLILAVLTWWQPRFILRVVAALNPEVLFFVQTEQPIVALTIDDAPYATLTPRILDVLTKHRAHATFFVIGDRVPGNEHLLHRIVDEGHEVGNHQFRDYPSIRLSPTVFEQELHLTHTQLAPFGPIRYFRPASGWFNQRMLDHVESYGYTTVLGSAYPEDLLSSPAYLARHILVTVQPGSIIILHDGTDERARTVAVLEHVLPELERRGYRVVTVAQLMASTREKQ